MLPSLLWNAYLGERLRLYYSVDNLRHVHLYTHAPKGWHESSATMLKIHNLLILTHWRSKIWERFQGGNTCKKSTSQECRNHTSTTVKLHVFKQVLLNGTNTLFRMISPTYSITKSSASIGSAATKPQSWILLRWNLSCFLRACQIRHKLSS